MAEQRPVTSNRVAGPRPSAAASLTPKEVFGILRRHILLIILLTVLGCGAGGGTWKLLQKMFPRFTARTLIQVLSPAEKDPMTIGDVQLQRDILYGYRFSMASLIKQQSTLGELLESDDVKDTEWYKGFRGSPAQKDRKRLKYLKKHFGAYAHRDGDFVEISMSCRAAGEAAGIVNKMQELFVLSQGTTERQEVSERMIKLEARRASVKRELDGADSSLQEVRTESGIWDLAMPIGRNFQHTITIRLNSLELEKNSIELAIKQLEANIGNLQELATGPVTEQIEFAIERDPVMVTLAQQLAVLEAQLSGRLSKFGENHRDVRQTREFMDEIAKRRELRKSEIAEQTRRASLENARDGLVVLRERYEELKKLRDEAKAEKDTLDQKRVQYEQRLKIRDERIAMLDLIKEQIEKLRIMHTDPETPKVLARGLAPVPLEMVFSRQWWLWFPSGTILGMLLGVGLAFLVELANDLVRTPSDVGRFLRIPLLGVIPDSSEDSQVRGIELCHAVRKAPYSIISESYRRCRTNLKLSGSPESLKTLLVSSGMVGDGKTSVAVNLATTFVAADKKVLLIDGNFRQPNLQSLFPKVETDDLAEPFDFGLSSVLTHQCASAEAVRSSGIEGLDLIDCGPLPANPAELLGSSRMEELLQEQCKKYDHVIVDGPPVLLVSDAKALAGLVDATILVFNAAATSRGAAKRTILELTEVNAKIVGCVLFAARAMKGGYFQEQFKSYRRYQKKAQLAGGTA
ncbi:MAG: polysaccharide biosynthesis tyrosine autokinase [Planctomycetota bacterium]